MSGTYPTPEVRAAKARAVRVRDSVLAWADRVDAAADDLTPAELRAALAELRVLVTSRRRPSASPHVVTEGVAGDG